MFLLPFKGREQRAHSPQALPCCEQPCSCTALCYPPLSCSTLCSLCKAVGLCFSPGPRCLLSITAHIFLCFFKKQSPNNLGGGRFDSTVTPHRLICQNIQVPQLMLRHLLRLFGNSLNFLLFGAQSFKLNINFIP